MLPRHADGTSKHMKTDMVRWGILSTADIGRKNWQAIRNSGNGRVTAVASRDGERSRRFIMECQREAPFDPVPTALGSYDALLASPDVDAVYIPLPTGLRKEWVLRAAAAGKHVLCEKPCAVRLSDLKEMTEACARNGVQFMDGVMFMHSERMARMRQAIDGGGLGTLRRIAASFSFCAPDEFWRGNIRAHSGLEPQGCLGDLGWYCLRFALWVMQWQKPREVTGRILAEVGRSDSPSPIPSEFSAELRFNEDVSASFFCSFRTGHQQWAHVSGTKGWLSVSDFVLPYFGSELEFSVGNPVFRMQGCNSNMEPHVQRITTSEYSNSDAHAQETHLFRRFGEIVRSGQLQREWPDMALVTQEVMDACLQSARTNAPVLLR
jgi:predicted dehydrogenase